ncbi:MAG: ABC transporter permease [Peptostreptococcaceae bacterium]|nr:ABC transporter permease [Peptostreptococcaceae bacterium]
MPTTLFFRMKNTLQYLRAHRRMNAVVFLAMTISFLFPLIALSSVSYHRQSIKNEIRPSEDPPQFVLQANLLSLQESRLREEIASLLPETGEIGVSAMLIRTMDLYRGNYETAHFQGMNPDLLRKVRPLAAGRYPSAEELRTNAPVALISYRDFIRLQMRLGDSISILGKELTVIGVVFEDKRSLSLFVPYALMQEMTDHLELSYRMYLWLENPSSTSDLQHRLQSSPLFEKELILTSYSDYLQKRYEGLDQVNTKLGLQALLTLSLSAFSVLFIATGRLHQMKHFFGIKCLCGSSFSDLLLDSWIETFVFSFAAACIDLLLLSLLRPYLIDLFPIFFSPLYFLSAFLMVLAFSFAVGMISCHLTASRPIVELMKE